MDIPNLVDARMDIGVHDQSVRSNMEIVEHVVMANLVAIGGELFIAEHLVASNEIAGLACIDGDL